MFSFQLSDDSPEKQQLFTRGLSISPSRDETHKHKLTKISLTIFNLESYCFSFLSRKLNLKVGELEKKTKQKKTTRLCLRCVKCTKAAVWDIEEGKCVRLIFYYNHTDYLNRRLRNIHLGRRE